MFSISTSIINHNELSKHLNQERSGAVVTFEGRVRNHNEGKQVSSLEYQVYHELAQKEGNKILEEAKSLFNIHSVYCVHAEGHLHIGDLAVWIGASASHRDDAFKACRFVIDQIKLRLPIWKKEHYLNQAPQWVFCRDHHHHVHFEEAEFYQKQKALVDQTKLKNTKILVVGAGGLGCSALYSLAMAGIGEIGIVDHDQVSISNIHRQNLYSPNLVGEKKVNVAKSRLLELNPFISIMTYDTYLTPSNIEEIITDYTIILDCTDNLKTKYLLQDAVLKFNKTLITASVYQYEAQMRTIERGSGCLRCINSQAPEDHLLGNCNDFGVLGSTTQVVGALQASEAIQFIINGKNNTTTHTHYFNLKNLEQMKVKNVLNPDCFYCQGKGNFKNEDEGLSISSVNDEFELVDIRQMSDEDVDKFKNYPKKVALCCHRGVRSLNLTKKLRKEGFDHIYSLRGGACSL